MRYFRFRNRVVRVHTDAPLGEDFARANAEVYSIRHDQWVDRPHMTSEIMYTGDWNPCTEADALDAIERTKGGEVKMASMRVTHRLSSGYGAVEIVPGVFCVEGRMVSSAASMSRFGVSVEPDDSDRMIEVSEAQVQRAHEIAESLNLGAHLIRQRSRDARRG